jgi:hypothetical protein
MDRQWVRGTLGILLCASILGLGNSADAKPKRMTEQQKAACRKNLHIDANGDQPLQFIALPPAPPCTTTTRNGFPIPDPKCTPGAVNPTLTLTALNSPAFKTGCVRDEATNAKQKTITYDWYGIKHPAKNTGADQVCELDHFISLEIGGADTLDNIWPQCGPSKVGLMNRYFKKKDIVENYLAWLVKNGQMDLDQAQRGIAADWTQYLNEAKAACPGVKCKKGNLAPSRH